MKIILSIFMFFYLATKSYGTTFFPITLDEQIAGSDGAVEAELISSDSFKNKNTVYTKFTFKVLSSYVIDQSEFEYGHLVLTLPGGSYQGVRTVVSGAPKFDHGLKTFLFLKKVEGHFFLSNYSVGKFNFQKINGEEYLVNEIFPMNPKIGRVKKSTLLEKLNIKNEVRAVTTQNENQITVPEVKKIEKAKREIASEKQDEDFSSSKIIVIIVALVGVFVVLLLMNKGRNEGE